MMKRMTLTVQNFGGVGDYFLCECATYQTHLLCLIFNPPLFWVFWLDNGAPAKTIQGENSTSGRSAPDFILHGHFA